MRTRWLYMLLIPGVLVAETARDFVVKEKDSHVELDTPWGSKIIMGDFLPESAANYKFEIPLKDLRPEPTPTPSPQAVPEKEKEVAASEANKTKKVVETVEEEVEDEASSHGSKAAVAELPPKMIVEYDDSDKLVVEANRLFNKGKFYEAYNVVEELLRKKPEHVRGWLMKGSLMKLKGHKDLAKSAWQKALTLDPQNKEIASLVKNLK